VLVTNYSDGPDAKENSATTATPRFARTSNDAVGTLAKAKPVKLPVSSSVRPKFPARQEAMFRETLMLLNRCRVPYAVSGAFALQVHTGIWRATKDIDLFLAPENIPAAICCLQKNGFSCRAKDAVWLHKARRHGFFVDLITGMSNAVITVEKSWIENARPAMVLDVRVRVLAAEELLVSKLFILRRERFDGADIAHIIHASQGSLDWGRILAQVKEHWEILLYALVLYRYVYPAYSQYVPAWVWQRLLGRFSTEVSKPTPAAPFRGSLVDDKMFSIDVKEWGMEDILRARRMARQKRVRKIAASDKFVASIRRKDMTA
jgi:hypothetical protein